MKKKKHSREQSVPTGFEQFSSRSDFYTGAPEEKPLYQDRPSADMNRVRKTARHQAVQGRRKEAVDPREKMAMVAIMRASVLLVLLIIAFFLLKKGVEIYEEKVLMDNQTIPEPAAVLNEVDFIENFNVSDQGQESFKKRIDIWKEAERMVRSVDELLLRNNVDQALDRCNDALNVDPYHVGALERMGEIYFQKGMFVESINTYIRLLNIDPSREEFQLALLKSLNAYGDPDSTVFVAQWYQDQNLYSEDVQRYIANAYFQQEKYTEASTAYARVLKDSPENVEALENLSLSWMRLKHYDKALESLEKLVAINFRDPTCYKRIAICNAQLGRGLETVQILGKSAHLFGQDTVVLWVQDPRLDPVRMDRTFQAFASRVGGDEFRRYLEKMAQTMDREPEHEIKPQLGLPVSDELDPEILKPEK